MNTARRACAALIWAAGTLTIQARLPSLESPSASLVISPTEVRLAHFRHDRFTTENGGPTDVRAIAQTPDGYLWLGSGDDLWRFDGATFEQVHPDPKSRFAGSAVTRLMVSAAGELWVGYNRQGGIAVYRHGRLIDAKLPDPPSMITGLAEDSERTIWAQWGAASKRLWRRRFGRWELVDAKLGVPPGFMMVLLPRHDGSVWVPVLSLDQRSAQLAHLEKGGSRFVSVPVSPDYPALAEDPRGQLWMTNRNGTWRIDGDTFRTFPPKDHYPPARGVARPDLHFDTWGGIWEATGSVGMVRIAAADRPGPTPQDQVERFRQADGLTSDRAILAFVDRQGNIWVGTTRGLDLFRYLNVIPVSAIPVGVTDSIHMSSAPDGTVSLVTGVDLYTIRPGGVATKMRLPLPQVDGFCNARDGGLWLSPADKTILRLKDGRIAQRVAIPSPTATACAEDGLHRLWIASADTAVRWHDGKGWHLAGRTDGSVVRGTEMSQNSRGQVAFSVGSGDVGLADGSRLIRIPISRLGLGSVRSVDPYGTGFLISMERGLVRIQDGRVRYLRSARYGWLAGLGTALQTPDGDVWLYADGRLARLPGRTLDLAFDDPAVTVRPRIFDTYDGLPADMQHPGYTGAQAAATADGRLWLATDEGVVTLNPRTVLTNRSPPPVAIRALSFGKSVIPDPVDLVLPPGTTSLRIVYAALDLSSPGRVQFRFKLSGIDSDWVDSGGRRATTYTNLSPGSYEFKVIAVGGNGVWNTQGATLRFIIKPTFVQSLPFKIACAFLGVLLLWLLYRARMRVVAANIRAGAAERHGERERIARDLHDTLIQSIHALILHVGVASDRLRAGDPAKEMLESALDRAADVVLEGREHIQALRTPRMAGTLEAVLDRLARGQFQNSPMTWAISATGEERPADPVTADEITLIAQEVFFNARQHARATRIEVEIGYQPQVLTVTFSDDGVGMDPAVVAAGGKDGHFGLIGMRERTKKMGGRLSTANLDGGGLRTTLTVPGGIAYLRERRLWSRIRGWVHG